MRPPVIRNGLEGCSSRTVSTCKREDSSMDIEVIRLKSELVALETLVIALTRSLASWQPSLVQSLRATTSFLTRAKPRVSQGSG